jgi:imidazole glycerol-phosphate synthase subunit HisF
MLRTRVIPTLLISDSGLVKTTKFKNPRYLGDLINAVRIFNDKGVDEIVVLDIDASRNSRGPDFTLIKEVASECFMPLAYGGGIKNIDEVKELFRIGVEKVILNSSLRNNLEFIAELSQTFGSQSIVASIDVKKNFFGAYKVYDYQTASTTRMSPEEFVCLVKNCGCGEIIIQDVDREGTMSGYELELIRGITKLVDIPIVASGGAGRIEDFRDAIDSGASAVTAGSFFVFKGPHRAVLINFPTKEDLEELFVKI